MNSSNHLFVLEVAVMSLDIFDVEKLYGPLDYFAVSLDLFASSAHGCQYCWQVFFMHQLGVTGGCSNYV